MLLVGGMGGYAADTLVDMVQGEDAEPALYTVFVNVAPQEFRFPLVGFVNIAQGNQTFPQIGFVNNNAGNFSGLQLGFVNITHESLRGVQIGFANTTVQEAEGLQLGFFNIAAKSLRGMQLGFFNYVDNVEAGIPIGFLSIVRRGGYKASETFFSNILTTGLSFKIGVEKFYTSIIAAYNPFAEKGIENKIATGFGFGSLLPIGGSFFINPEWQLVSFLSESSPLITSAGLYAGFNINAKISLSLGPSLSWIALSNNSQQFPQSLFGFERKLDDKRIVIIGAQAALRMRL
jgi:hypothetical protein